MRTKALRHSGFTISEIIIVFAIIAVLVSLLIPSYTSKCGRDPKNYCISNLKQLDGAVQQWAVENRKLPTDTVSLTNILGYLQRSNYPVCPEGGVYTVTIVGVSPTCTKSASGHTL